jgi:hypothetical protein
LSFLTIATLFNDTSFETAKKGVQSLVDGMPPALKTTQQHRRRKKIRASVVIPMTLKALISYDFNLCLQ